MNETRELMDEIKGWIVDYEKSFPPNVQVDYDDDTYEGSAYNLLHKALLTLVEFTTCELCGKKAIRREALCKKCLGI